MVSSGPSQRRNRERRGALCLAGPGEDTGVRLRWPSAQPVATERVYCGRRPGVWGGAPGVRIDRSLVAWGLRVVTVTALDGRAGRARSRSVVVPPLVAGHRRGRAVGRSGGHHRSAAPAGRGSLVLLGSADVV